MATNINYPANLPCPLLSGNTHQPGNTFIRSEFDYAIRQRKQYCAQYSVGFSFVVKSQIKMQAFKDFFYNTLNYGVNSFLADWEIEGMDGIKEFRFSSNYTTVALGASRYRITASFDMLTKIKGLLVIPSIQYSMDVISTELDGTRYIKNDGKGGSSFNAEAFASNHIYLNGTTQSVPYPALHTLALDSKKIATSVDAGWTDNANNTYTGSTVTGDIVGVSTDTSGVVKVIITLSSVTAGDVEGYTADGTYTFEETLSASLNLTGTGFTGTAEVVSVEAITLPTSSYLTYFDSTTNTLTELSSTGDVGKNLFSNSTFDTDTDWTKSTGWTISGGTANVDGLAGLWLYQSVSTVIGRLYKSIADCVTTNNAEMSVGSKTPLDIATVAISTGNEFSRSITASATTTEFGLRTNSSILGKFDNYFVREILPISTTYSVTDSHQFVFNHTSPLSAADKAAIEADPNLAFRMFFDSEVLPSGFSNTDVGWFSGGNEGLASAEKVYDLSDQTFLTYVSIVGYDAATKTTLANKSNGASNLKLIRNVSGGTTGTAVANTTQWEADGRTAVTDWTITAPFTITEPIDGDIYTFTSAGNRYKNTVADGTYTLPTGIWTLDEFGFDGVTPVTARGVTKKVNEIVVP